MIFFEFLLLFWGRTEAFVQSGVWAASTVAVPALSPFHLAQLLPYAECFGMGVNQRANSITNIFILDSLGGMKECCSSRWNLQVWFERWDKWNLLNWISLSIQVSILQREVLCKSKSLNYSATAVTLLSLSIASISLSHSSTMLFLKKFIRCKFWKLWAESFLFRTLCDFCWTCLLCFIINDILTSEFAWPVLLGSNTLESNLILVKAHMWSFNLFYSHHLHIEMGSNINMPKELCFDLSLKLFYIVTSAKLGEDSGYQYIPTTVMVYWQQVCTWCCPICLHLAVLCSKVSDLWESCRPASKWSVMKRSSLD